MCPLPDMQRPEVTIAVTSLTAVLVMMMAELMRSRRNERVLRRRGAVEAKGDVYRMMAFAYPGMFVAMAVEGARFGPSPDAILLGGFVVFVAAKLLKLWAIAALGSRWSYRVLVLPGIPLITSGPYAHLRHPNYVAVFGEIAGFAMMVDARMTGALSVILFAVLVRRRIAIEEHALKEAQGSGLRASGAAQG
jgi:methyltransferase